MTERRRPEPAPVLDYNRLADRMDRSDAAVVARVESLFDDLRESVGERLKRIELDVATLRQEQQRDQNRYADIEEQIARTREEVVAELQGHSSVSVEKVASGVASGVAVGVAEGVTRGSQAVSTKQMMTLGGIIGGLFIGVTQAAPWVAKFVAFIVQWAKLNTTGDS